MNCTAAFAAEYLKLTWCNPTTLLVTLVGFFAFSFWLLWQRKSTVSCETKDDTRIIHFRDLPSPRGYPVVGHVTKLGTRPHVVLTEWAKEYGSMFRIRMGFQDALVVTGLETIRKAAVKQSITFAGRPHLETSKLVCAGLSLTFSNYSPAWEHQKQSAKAAVMLYTTGKDPSKRSVLERSSAHHANNLADQLIESAQNEANNLVNPRAFILTNVSNAICSVCFGRIFRLDDPLLKELLSINRNFDEAMGASQPVNFWPFLKYFPVIGKSFRNLQVYMSKFWAFVSNLLESHWRTYDDNNMRDITDCLYHDSEKERRNNNEKVIGSPIGQNGIAKHPAATPNGATSNGAIPNGATPNGTKNESPVNGNVQRGGEYYSEHKHRDSILADHFNDDPKELELRRRIVYTTGDIFGAGYDTVFTAVSWGVFYMAAFPDTQNKIREEIERVVSPDEEPSYTLHSSRCPYTQAWVYEMLRHTSLVPLLLPHSTTESTVFENCIIPKGTMVYFNAWQAHKDPAIWEDPEEFRPERFLEEKDGSLSLKRGCVSKLLTWGAGKRTCLGQHLSRYQMFIFIAVIARRCVIEQSRPGIEPALPWPYDFGITIKPKAFNVKVLPR